MAEKADSRDLTIGPTAETTGLSESQIRRLVAEGQVNAAYQNGRNWWRFSPEAVAQLQAIADEKKAVQRLLDLPDETKRRVLEFLEKEAQAYEQPNASSPSQDTQDGGLQFHEEQNFWAQMAIVFGVWFGLVCTFVGAIIEVVLTSVYSLLTSSHPFQWTSWLLIFLYLAAATILLLWGWWSLKRLVKEGLQRLQRQREEPEQQ